MQLAVMPCLAPFGDATRRAGDCSLGGDIVGGWPTSCYGGDFGYLGVAADDAGHVVACANTHRGKVLSWSCRKRWGSRLPRRSMANRDLSLSACAADWLRPHPHVERVMGERLRHGAARTLDTWNLSRAALALVHELNCVAAIQLQRSRTLANPAARQARRYLILGVERSKFLVVKD